MPGRNAQSHQELPQADGREPKFVRGIQDVLGEPLADAIGIEMAPDPDVRVERFRCVRRPPPGSSDRRAVLPLASRS